MGFFSLVLCGTQNKPNAPEWEKRKGQNTWTCCQEFLAYFFPQTEVQSSIMLLTERHICSFHRATRVTYDVPGWPHRHSSYLPNMVIWDKSIAVDLNTKREKTFWSGCSFLFSVFFILHSFWPESWCKSFEINNFPLFIYIELMPPVDGKTSRPASEWRNIWMNKHISTRKLKVCYQCPSILCQAHLTKHLDWLTTISNSYIVNFTLCWWVVFQCLLAISVDLEKCRNFVTASGWAHGSMYGVVHRRWCQQSGQGKRWGQWMVGQKILSTKEKYESFKWQPSIECRTFAESQALLPFKL